MVAKSWKMRKYVITPSQSERKAMEQNKFIIFSSQLWFIQFENRICFSVSGTGILG